MSASCGWNSWPHDVRLGSVREDTKFEAYSCRLFVTRTHGTKSVYSFEEVL